MRNRVGNVTILHYAHSYNPHGQRENYWRCSFKGKCSGLSSYVEGILTIKTPHICKANIGVQKAKIAKAELLRVAATSAERTGEIVNNNLSHLDEGN